MIGRIIVWLGLMATAVMCFIVQVDRQSLAQPQLAAIVPDWLGGAAKAYRAEAALQAGNGAEGLELARELVRARPMPAEHLTLLAQAQVLSDETDAGIATMQAATTRGWRVPPVQLAVAQGAFQIGEYGTAADRLAAIMAVGADNEMSGQLLGQVLAQGEGRAAFAAKLGGEGYWQARFFRSAITAADPQDLLETMLMAEGNGFETPCDNYQGLLRELSEEQANAVTLPERCR